MGENVSIVISLEKRGTKVSREPAKWMNEVEWAGPLLHANLVKTDYIYKIIMEGCRNSHHLVRLHHLRCAG